MSLPSSRPVPAGQHLASRKSYSIVAVFGLIATISLALFAIDRSKTHRIVPVPSTDKSQTEATAGVTALASATSGQPCALDVHAFGATPLAPTVQYTRLEVVVSYSDEHPGLFQQQLDVPLPKSHSIRVDHDPSSQSTDECPEPIRVQVPRRSEHTDASHIILGVATTLDRLDDSLDAFAHWAGRSGARILALIEPVPAANIRRVTEKAERLSIDLQIKESDAEYNDRVFSLIKLLFSQRQTAQWAAIIDDDTFFPSMPALVARLAELDPSQPHYVGGLSENLEQIRKHGIIAYGGAGIFISTPLLAKMNSHWDECNRVGVAGDMRIAQCIYNHTTTKLTWEHKLSQIDLFGDPSGFYEAGRSQPLSLHHWKSWNHIDVVRLSAVSAICGDACLLMRWRFADGWILTNGYSMVKHSQLHRQDSEGGGDDGLILTMEKTWDDQPETTDESFLHSFGPLRPKDHGKISYLLDQVVVVPDGSRLHQYYVHRSEDGGLIDRVVEVVWRN